MGAPGLLISGLLRTVNRIRRLSRDAFVHESQKVDRDTAGSLRPLLFKQSVERAGIGATSKELLPSVVAARCARRF
jgi:hypothetical protein